MSIVDAGGVGLTQEQTAELRAVINSRDVSGAVATRGSDRVVDGSGQKA
jgi:hypothetical protein